VRPEDLSFSTADVSVGHPTNIRDGWVRSYLADGRLVQWRPPRDAFPAIVRWAVDAETAAAPVPVALARRTKISDPAVFWPQWTAVEVACKLLHIPIMAWIAAHSVDGSPASDLGVVCRTLTHLDLVVTVGALATATDASGDSVQRP